MKYVRPILAGTQEPISFMCTPWYVYNINICHTHTHTYTHTHTHRFIHINCLSFSTDDTYLISSSNTETVHIFRLIDPPPERYLSLLM